MRLTVTSDGAGPTDGYADETGLQIAYPNPSHENVGIAFLLTARGTVTAEIYDIQGRHLRRLEREDLPAGEHVLVWDGRDEAGRLAKPGVYLVRCRCPGVAPSVIRLVRVD